MKNFLLFLFFIGGIGTLSAQNYDHWAFWGRLNVQKKINDRWDAQGEYIYRRQDTPETRGQIWDKPLVKAYRGIVNYRTKHWIYMVNPNYFVLFPLLGKPNDTQVPPNHEFRFTTMLERVDAVSKKWTLRNRLGYEYRVTERNNWLPTGRLRYRAQGRYGITPKKTIVASVEPLWNVGPRPAVNRFSQIQNILLLQYNASQRVMLEGGGIFNYRQRATLIEYDLENALILSAVMRF